MNALVATQAQSSAHPVAYAVSEMQQMARAIAASGLFGVKNEAQALSLMLVAQASGLHPATAAQDYDIIQGRPSKKAEAMLRDFIRSGGKVQWHALGDTEADATFTHPQGGEVRINWDIDRARMAGLGGKDMWKKFPRQMLRSRVVSEGIRTVCPMATGGMYVPEEVRDFSPDPQVETATVVEISDASSGTIRKSSAQAKRDGDHDRIMSEIEACDTLDKLEAWEATFEDRTAELPAKWLEPIQDRVEIKRNELIEALERAD